MTSERPDPPVDGTITTWRKRPVAVEAARWTGANADEVRELTGLENFLVLDAADRANCDNPDATAPVYDKLHSTWVLVFDGQWIIRGVKGEFYPCADDVFRETYEPARDRHLTVWASAAGLTGRITLAADDWSMGAETTVLTRDGSRVAEFATSALVGVAVDGAEARSAVCDD